VTAVGLSSDGTDIAAAAAFGAVEAFGSFDQGANVVPQDIIAQIHAGERIIPAADNSALMSALGANGGGAGGAGAGAGVSGGDTYHISVPVSGNIQNPQDFGTKVANAIAQQIRQHNPNLRPRNYGV
jgi:hypothetical protein